MKVKNFYKIGIYDRYLSTAGGGERYSCKIAEILSENKNYSVDLITDLYADLDIISKRLNLNLSSVKLKIYPFLSDDYAKKITSNYDIFINATYLSSLPAYAKRNIYLCYFPTPFDVDFKFIHRLLLFLFRIPAVWLYRLAEKIISGNNDVRVEAIEGVYDVKRFILRRGSFISSKSIILYNFSKLVNTKNIIRVGLKNPKTLGAEKINVKLELYKYQHNHQNSPKVNIFDLIFNEDLVILPNEKKIIEIDIKKALKEKVLIKIKEDKNQDEIDRDLNLSYDNFILDKNQNTFFLKIYSDVFLPRDRDKESPDTRCLGAVVYNEQKINFVKKFLLKLVGFIPLFLITFPKNLDFLNTYQKIISISQYSYTWIKKLWSRESQIIYPPVDVENFYKIKKEKIILSVGRFFPEHHNKKQLELAEAFIEIYKENIDILKDYKLILVGGVEQKSKHLEYVEKIKDISIGYPIEVLTNISWEELKNIFAKALIFWHAAGMGEDENKAPEKFEHFGITTVEAMASGCVCVVINKGGQPEIISDGVDGFLFSSWEDLKEITLKICSGKIEIRKISEQAVIKARQFSSIKFKERLLEVIKNEISYII